MKTFKRILIATVLALSLVACGGGGSAKDKSGGGGGGEPPEEIPISLTVDCVGVLVYIYGTETSKCAGEIYEPDAIPKTLIIDAGDIPRDVEVKLIVAGFNGTGFDERGYADTYLEFGCNPPHDPQLLSDFVLNIASDAPFMLNSKFQCGNDGPLGPNVMSFRLYESDGDTLINEIYVYFELI